jgi:hypothetical protein
MSCHAFYKDKKKMQKVTNIKYLGLGIHKHLDWKFHTEQVIPKLGTAWYAVRFM